MSCFTGNLSWYPIVRPNAHLKTSRFARVGRQKTGGLVFPSTPSAVTERPPSLSLNRSQAPGSRYLKPPQNHGLVAEHLMAQAMPETAETVIFRSVRERESSLYRANRSQCRRPSEPECRRAATAGTGLPTCPSWLEQSPKWVVQLPWRLGNKWGPMSVGPA